MTIRVSALALLGAGVCGLGAVQDVAAEELTISIWGGSYAEEFQKQVVEPFEQATGATVRVDAGLASERLSKLMATRGRGADLIYLTDYQMAELRKRDLLRPIDGANVPNLSQLYDFARDPLGGGLCPAFTVAGVGLAYNKDHYAEPPQSWSELFRTDLQGKAGYVDMSVSYGPLMLIEVAKLSGGSIDDVDPAFAKLAEVKDDLQFFTRREILDSINQGDVSVAPHLNIFVTRDESVPLRFAWPKEGGLGVLNLACVVKGTEVPELAEKFIDFHLSKEVQERMVAAQGETPVNRQAEIADDLSFNVISASDIENLQFFDVDKIVEHRAEWLERWQEEIVAQ